MATQDWATASLRQKVVEEIEGTYKIYGNPTSKSSREVERQILEKAQSRDTYLQMIARLILHIKEVRGRHVQNTPSNQQQTVLGQVVSNMGGNNAAPSIINMTIQPNSQVQNNTTNQIQVTTDQQSANNTLQQAKFSQQQNVLFGNALNQVAGNTGGQSVQVTVKNGQIINQRGILQPQQGQQQQTTNAQQLQQQIQLQQQLQQQQQQTSQQNIPMQNFITNATGLVMQQGGLLQQQQQQQQLKANEIQLFQQRLQQSQQQQQNKGYGNVNMSNVNFTMSSPLVANQQQQQQNQQNQQIFKNVPSPSQQILASPAVYNQPVPSPANPPSIGPSPSPMNQADEMAYLEKLKELNKYVEPLRKLLLSSPKDDDHKKERDKLSGLLDILTKKRKVPLSVLIRCETVLKTKLHTTTQSSTGSLVMKTPDSMATAESSIPTPVRQSNHPQFGEVVTNVFTSANLMSETRQNILPGMYALNAPMICPPAPPARTRMRPKPYDQQKKSPLPRALQMEIINLSTERFHIFLDKSKSADKSGVTLKCEYTYDTLPTHLCNIFVQVHADYPKVEPTFFLNHGVDDSTQELSNLILKKLARLPHSLTFTAILTSWEQSLMEYCTT